MIIETSWQTTQPPLDGSWIYFWTVNDDLLVQYDSTAYGEKGGWFNKRGHAVDAKYATKWRLPTQKELDMLACRVI